MGMSAQPLPRLSVEEYLAIDRKAAVKSEFYQGEMFAMSGGSLAHSLLPAGLTLAIGHQLRGKGCAVVTSDLRIRISPQGAFVYPDLAIVCGEPQLADDHRDILLNPAVVFEVLSPSSEAYDRGHKFAEYRKIPSLREYVLVSQEEPRLDVFTRGEGGKWTLTEFVGKDAICLLTSVDCRLPLAEIYYEIKFDAGD